MASLFARFVSDRRGAVSFIAIGGMMMMIGSAAAAVDMGSVFLQTRKLQGIADLAAMAAARDLDRAAVAAQATADLNDWKGPLVVQTTLGAFDDNPAKRPQTRFSPGAGPANAVRVKIDGKADLFFAQVLIGKAQFDISRTATAARAELAAFSIGTRLASVEGGGANALLTALTGSEVKLSVMDYNALASADVDLLRYTDALRTRAALQGGTFNDLLQSDIPANQALAAAADVLEQAGNVSAGQVMRRLASAAITAPKTPLDRLLSLGPYGLQDHAAKTGSTAVAMDAMDLANAILMVSQGGRQLKFDLGVNAPGLLTTTVWLAVGERPANSPWIAVGRNGEDVIVHTAQSRLYIEAKAASVLGVLGAQLVKIPLFIETAPSTAKLSAVSCPLEGEQSATLAVQTGLGRASLAELDPGALNNFQSVMVLGPATLVDAKVLLLKAKVTARADIALGGGTWRTVRFSRADITAGRVQTVSTADIAQSVASSLTRGLDLNVTVAGLGLPVSAVTAPVAATLSQVAGPLDSAINALTDLLGVKLGQADVRVNGLRCRDAALVS